MGAVDDYVARGGLPGIACQQLQDELMAALTDRRHLLHNAANLLNDGKIDQASQEIVVILRGDLPQDHPLKPMALMVKLAEFQSVVLWASEVFLRNDICIEEQTLLTKDIPIEAIRFAEGIATTKQNQRNKASKSRADGLTKLIEEILQRKPTITPQQLKAKIENLNKQGVITDIADGEIAFNNPDGTEGLAKMSDLKNRLYRIRKNLSSP